MLVTQTTFRLFIWRHNLKEQRKSLKHILRPFLCSLSLSRPSVPRKQFFHLYCRNFLHYIRRGKVPDQTLLADKHLPTNHRTEDVAFCHVAVDRSHRQAGQLCRQLARQGIGMFAPTFCYVFAQFLCLVLRQYDGRYRRLVPLRRKPPVQVGKAFGMVGHLLAQGLHIAHPQGVPMRFVAVILVADIAVLQHKQEFSLGYMQVRSRRVRADDLFHALTTYQKSAPRLVVMPIIEQRADGFRTDVFSALVQVRIDICRCTDVRVTKVFRYVEQRDVLVDEDAGEGMPQVVEADVPHTVLFKHLREAERDISRCQKVAQLVRAYIIVVCAVVTALEHTAVELLLRLLFDQHFINRCGDRQASAAAGVLHFLNRFENFLAVNLNF